MGPKPGKSGRPKGVPQNFPLPPQISYRSGGSLCGVVAAVQGHGPPKVRAWASLESFCASLGGPTGRPEFTKCGQAEGGPAQACLAEGCVCGPTEERSGKTMKNVLLPKKMKIGKLKKKPNMKNERKIQN